MAGHDQFDPTPRQQFSSGHELINAVKTRREEAQAFKALAQDVDAEIAGGLDQYDPELIDGVRVLWISQGTAARDETKPPLDMRLRLDTVCASKANA